jgi:hypothetical protein
LEKSNREKKNNSIIYMVWSHKGKGSKRGENRRSEWERKILCKGEGEEEHRGGEC